MAEIEDKDTRNAFRAVGMTVTEKCTQCPLRIGNVGTECWQGGNGAGSCHINTDNLVPGSAIEKGVHDYQVAMQKAAQHDAQKQDDAILAGVLRLALTGK